MDAVLCNEAFSRINFHFCSVIFFLGDDALCIGLLMYTGFTLHLMKLNLPSLFVYVGSQCMPEIAFLTSGYLEHRSINASMFIAPEHMRK